MRYDLLLKNCHLLDPGEGLDGPADVAVAGGVIAAIEPGIPDAGAREVLDAGGAGRYVVPGLLDIHAHVAYGATTPGVGMACCDPDDAGIRSGVTTVLDAGSAGIANIGVFPAHILPKARTRVLCYLNVGSFAHTTGSRADFGGFGEIDADGIASCVAANPGLVKGMKLRLVGPLVATAGEKVIAVARDAARQAGVPLMVHIGDLFAQDEPGLAGRLTAVTEFLLGELQAGDILTHLCTPSIGGIGRAAGRLDPALHAARDRGVILDAALGMGNFGFRVAREQFERGLFPDTISSDLTGVGASFHSLMECMAKFMAIGYSLADVVTMTTANAARAAGLADVAGAIKVGREADLTVMDVVESGFRFTDTRREEFTGRHGIRPVQTVRAGKLVAPRWGTHPWGWLPEASRGAAAGGGAAAGAGAAPPA